MSATFSRFARNVGALAGAVTVLTGASAGDTKTTIPTDAFPVFESYIKVTGQNAAITGDAAAYAKRAQKPEDGSYGIEDLHFARDFNKDSSMQIDGRALSGSEDYLAKLRLAKTDFGDFEVGYQRFRTFYDGIGGFFPRNNEWMPLLNEDLHLDRGKFWVEGTFARPDTPSLTFRYTNELRDGRKDSTIWGDTDFTGLPNNIAPISQVRKIVPSYIKVGERHQSFETTLKHTVGKTTVALTYVHDSIDNLDTRYVTRFPGEAKPFPTPAATVLLPAAKMNNQILQQQTDGISSKSNALMGTSETLLTDKLTFNLGGNVQMVSSDFTGDRPLVTNTPVKGSVMPIATATFKGLVGTAHAKVYTGTASLDIKARKDLTVKVGVRAEAEYTRASSDYTVLAASGTPATTVTATPRHDWSKINQHSATPVIDARYTGIPDVALYFDGSLRNLKGTEKDSSAYNPLTTGFGTLANNSISQDNGNYTLGANWKQSQFLTLRAEGFRKHHQYESTGFSYSLGDYYLVDSDFTGVRLTAAVKPFATVTATSRYIYQSGKMQVTGFLPTYPAFDSGNVKNHTFSETIDFNPIPQWYAQLSGSAVYNVIDTIYPRAGITPATKTTVAFNSNLLVQNANNNYFTASVLSGWVVAKNTDAQVQFTYYRATNGNAQIAALTQPYGVDAQESVITVGLKHKLSDRIVVNGKVGYIDAKNATNGGFTDFRGPLAYVSLEYRL